MANRLSHSSINRHLFCQQSWYLHYVEGYRSVELSSALPFGSAFGKACEYLLQLNSKAQITLPDELKEKVLVTAHDIFDYHWNYADVNGTLTNIKEYGAMQYSKYDVDYDLMTDFEKTEAMGNDDLKSWYSLRHKAHLMLDCFETELLPKIKKIYSTEEKIELSNDEGDSSIGFSDTVVDIDGYPTPVILDFKTASREYDLNSVRRSVQLSQYLHVLGEKYNTRLAGYAVFLKQIEKNKVKTCKSCGNIATGSHKTCNNIIDSSRCNGEWKEKLNPKAKMQLIIDEIPLATEEFIIGNIENVNNAIKSGVITKNTNGCFDNGWGRPCEFQQLCWENNMDGIVKVEKK